MQEICIKSTEQLVNLWKVEVKYKENGATMIPDSRTRSFIEDPETYQRYMINYFGLGEDGRIGGNELYIIK